MPWHAALTLLVVLALPRPAGAVDVAEFIGQPIASVALREEGRDIRDEALLDLLETRVGEPLDMQRVRESLLHLFSLGRYQDVRVEANATEAGVALVYAVVPVHPVRRYEFQGDLGLSEGLVRETVIDRFGRNLLPERTDEVVRILLQLYRDRGFVNARVTSRSEVEHAPDQTILVFEIQSGPQARVGEIVVGGAALMSRPELLDRLNLEPGRPYDRLALERRLEDFEDTLRARGRYEARADHQVTFSPDGTRADLVLDINAGPLVSLVFTGDPLPPDRLDDLVPVRAEGSIDRDLLEDSQNRIVDFLRAQGHWRAQVDLRRIDTVDGAEVIFDVRAGPVYRTGAVEISGNVELPLSVIDPILSLRPGDPFVESSLDADVAGILERYRRAGFDGAVVESAVLEPGGAAGAGLVVTPRILIREGPRTLVDAISFEGNENVPDAELQAEMALMPGAPLYRPQMALDRDRVLLAYLNLGYPDANVTVAPRFSDDRTNVEIAMTVREGPLVTVDHVLIVGNSSVGTQTIRRELAFQSGDPLALDKVEDSQRRLRALGLLRSVRITEIASTDETRRDILVTVEEAPATSIGYGAGLEGGRRLRRSTDPAGGAVERLEFAPRGFFEIGRRNLWGKNRSVDLFTRLSVRPKDAPDSPAEDGQGLGFSEYRVVGSFREPRAFFADADLVVTGFLEQAIRSSFSFQRQGANAEMLRRLSPALYVNGRLALERTRLFDERFNPEDQLLIDRLFPRVRLATVSTGIVRDTRNDPLDPIAGELFGGDTKVAGRAIGSEVGFGRTFLQAFLYRRLPGARPAVVAFGARVGLARGFSREVAVTDARGAPLLDDSGQPVTETVREVPASERFFAGGDTTVRGFALDRLGTDATIDQDGFPTGGNALLVLNGEVRVPVWRELGAVAFLDLGNVFARVSDLDLGEVRGGAGFGLRYRSPIGPIRVDLGFKLDRKEFANGTRESRTALHISIGQAF